jgi:hypothetical protein
MVMDGQYDTDVLYKTGLGSSSVGLFLRKTNETKCVLLHQM